MNVLLPTGTSPVGLLNGYLESESCLYRTALVRAIRSSVCFPSSCEISPIASRDVFLRFAGMKLMGRCGNGPAIEVTNALVAESKAEPLPRVRQEFM